MKLTTRNSSSAFQGNRGKGFPFFVCPELFLNVASSHPLLFLADMLHIWGGSGRCSLEPALHFLRYPERL